MRESGAFAGLQLPAFSLAKPVSFSQPNKKQNNDNKQNSVTNAKQNSFANLNKKQISAAYNDSEQISFTDAKQISVTDRDEFVPFFAEFEFPAFDDAVAIVHGLWLVPPQFGDLARAV